MKKEKDKGETNQAEVPAYLHLWEGIDRGVLHDLAKKQISEMSDMTDKEDNHS